MEPRQRGGNFRVTDRDMAVVGWIGRQRFVEAAQVARRFEMHDRKAYRRLRGLVTVGWLGHRRVFYGQPGVYWATKLGLTASGLDLGPAGIDTRTYEHDRLAADVAIELEEEFGRSSVATERELRSREAAAGEQRYGVRRGMATGRQGVHFPDLAVERGDGRPLAIEIELTAKGRARLASIIDGYVRARHFAGVRYYVAPAAARGLERAIARAEAGELFDVRPIDVRGSSR